MAYLCKYDGTRVDIDTPVSLQDAYRLLETDMVEVVSPRATPGIVFLCDEEGLLKPNWRDRINRHGCDLYGTAQHGHPIVGHIIVFATRREAKGWL